MRKRKRMLQMFVCLLLIGMFLGIAPLTAYGAEETGDEELEQTLAGGVESLLGELDLEKLRELYDTMPELFGGMSFEEAIREIAENGLTQITAEQAINAAFGALKSSLVGNGWYIVEIIVLLLAAALLGNLRSSFSQASVSKAAFWATYIVICTLTIAMISQCVSVTRQALDTLFSLVETLTPILVALLTGMGGLTTSNLLSPALAGLTGGVFAVIKSVVFPAILVSAVFSLSSNISSTIKLNKFSDLIDSAVKWFLGIVLVLFIGITTVKGLTGAALDGVSIKTAKFAVDKMVPVIGSMFSDTLDTLMACSLIVKNAVGVVGLVLMVCILGAPLATLIVNMFLLKIAAAVAEPFADPGSVNMLSAMSNTVMLLFITLLSCIAMAFILITLFMGAADMSMMMR